jgi:hypothetical protein
MANSIHSDSAEIWKPVPGWEHLYLASSMGRVRSLPRTVPCGHGSTQHRPGMILKPWKLGLYLGVTLYGREKPLKRTLHKLICETFHGPMPSPKMVAAHGNGDRTDNRAANLRWATYTENCADMAIHGTRLKGEAHPMARLSAEDVLDIRRRAARGESQRSIARLYGSHQGSISNIVLGKVWAHV